MQPSTLDLGRKNYLIGCFLNEQRQNVRDLDVCIFSDASLRMRGFIMGIGREFYIKILLKHRPCLRSHVRKISYYVLHNWHVAYVRIMRSCYG